MAVSIGMKVILFVLCVLEIEAILNKCIMDKMNRIGQKKWVEICALKIDMFETHVNHLKNQLEIIKNDKDYSDE